MSLCLIFIIIFIIKYLASTLRSLVKGEHRGFCFESRGQGHSAMLIQGLVLNVFHTFF